MPGGVVLYVAEPRFVVIGLAQVVQQRNEGETLLVVLFRVKAGHQHVIHVDAVHHKAAFARAVKTRGGRSRIKIRGRQPVQQLLRAGAGDIFGKNTDKLCFVIHTVRSQGRSGCPSEWPARRG